MVFQDSNADEDVNTRIFHSIADVFQKAQVTYAGHRKHVAVLKKIQEKAVSQGYEAAFNYWFNAVVSKVLPLRKNEVIGDRIVKLVAAFIASRERDLNRDEADMKQEETSEAEDVFMRFMDQFIRHILRGIESKDKNVRYRVVHFLAMIMDNIGELDESLYNTLVWSLKKRIYDKEANVRMQVVFCLTKFQDDETIEDDNNTKDATKMLISLVQNDPSAEVRRAAMLNLVVNSKTLSFILERARDTNQVNRRLVYTRVLKSLGKQCFDHVNSEIIDQLVKWGLEDREPLVRTACSKLISHDWLNLLGGDLIGFLEKLNVTESQVSVEAMECLFNTRSDIIPKVTFPQEIWLELTVEISFLSRCFYHHCVQNQLNEIIEKNFPEASKWANYLNHYIKQRFSNEANEVLSDADKYNLDFIIKQLLVIGNDYDFSDEIGRRAMLNVVRNMLGIFELSESLVDIGLQVLKSLSINEKDFVTMAIEIINDIRDDDIERQEQEEAILRKDRIDSDDDNDDDIESFRRAVESRVSGKSPPEGDILKNLPPPKEAGAETIVVCLTRSSHMLKLIKMPLEQNILITSLIDTLITPAVRNNDSKIRELGVNNLGLCCLLDLHLATENMYIFGMCVSKGNSALKQIALKVIIDIFSLYGLEVVNGEGKVDSISLHKIFYKVLKNYDSPECQVVAAEGLCKLFLADVFTDDDLFETLVLSYFSPVNSSNEALIQSFAFCIPVYCFSHVNHQKRLARIAADVLLRLCMLWEDLQVSDDSEKDHNAMLKPNIILQQLIRWIDPRNLINQKEDEIAKNSVQLDFLLDFVQILPRIDKKETRKLLLTNINTVFITAEQEYHKLKKLTEYIEDLIESETLDTVSRNALQKFNENLIKILDAAYEKELHRGENESTAHEDRFYQLLEAPGTDSDRSVSISEENAANGSGKTNGEDQVPYDSTKKRRRPENDGESTFFNDGIPYTKESVDVNMIAKSNNESKNVGFALPEADEQSDDAMSIDI
ncbi:hypothetical protein HG535_0C03460 [Zygotorulaspora mrakii]|uniref:Nuclear condensin complex subunit 3 C-terminal domain-containing protein n=1 Tax=Zygotorulaspora mrakii TaxID=42260 RepID=A0A7H9B0G6_ZYGMR|nr:uncharacterized protein HG535_0C03460 [Zygotorulaspora mrakii]QLG71993.1 hypothetical protein HG535_0C03460 [Zygotorulaspora mrakii]